MIEIYVWVAEPQGYLPSYFRIGDIVKVHPPGWHKYFPYDEGKVTLRVKNMEWDHVNKKYLTDPLRNDHGQIIQRRRYAINMEELKRRKKKPNKKGVIKVRSLDGLLVDKLV